MKMRTLFAPGIAMLLLVGGVSAQGDCSAPAAGPDVIVGSLPSVGNFGGTGGVGGYSIGTTSCNIGTAELLWIAGNNQHPVIGQNFYRMENGRFEQIGMSWLKHGFTALQGNVCCSCTSSGTGTRLGVGCSDPYGAGLNGSQGGLGPRYQVNAFTGVFSYPFFGQGQSGNQIYKRAQIPNTDLDPSLHPTALYFGEGQYVTPDDAFWGNQANNASYRQLNVNGFSSGSWNMSTTGSTQRTKPALQAWADNDAGVNFSVGKVPNEGTFFIASKATDNGNGTWHYEYAIQNLTSDVSIGSFAVPLIGGVNVTNAGFSDIDYHSGEPWDGTDWTPQILANEVRWETVQTHAQDPDGNAIRWGTLYNFWFDADAPPGLENSDIGFFKPHTPTSTSIKVDAPVGDEVWLSIGGGTTGVNGPPQLTMSGPLAAATNINLDLVDAAPSALALIFISFSSTPASFLGGTLHAFPFDELVIVGTDGVGEIHGAANFPGAASGSELYWQIAIEDLSVPAHLASLSNGVVGTVP